ncbi:MAG: hypothetical protein K0R25_284 [Rickettsiaceae bacterium]|jgi:lipopolysaccharide transport protein LptA|nr:hypothetical protein [Rickettsiaceae bacterium]
MIFARLALIFSLFFLSASTVFAAQKTIITKIKSNFIDIERSSETVKLTDNVVVERDDMSVTANKMILYYHKDEETEQNSITKIEAIDNVKIFNGEFVATGRYGIYRPSQNNVTLQDNVTFNNGTSVARGEKFIYDLKTKKGHLVGASPDNEKTKKINTTEPISDRPVDNRVIVIIDDETAKNSKKKPKEKENE